MIDILRIFSINITHVYTFVHKYARYEKFAKINRLSFIPSLNNWTRNVKIEIQLYTINAWSNKRNLSIQARNGWNNVRNIHRLTRNVDYSINGEYLMTKIRDGRSCFYYGPLRDIKHLVESNTREWISRECLRYVWDICKIFWTGIEMEREQRVSVCFHALPYVARSLGEVYEL